jgi:hypothetical protein
MTVDAIFGMAVIIESLQIEVMMLLSKNPLTSRIAFSQSLMDD